MTSPTCLRATGGLEEKRDHARAAITPKNNAAKKSFASAITQTNRLTLLLERAMAELTLCGIGHFECDALTVRRGALLGKGISGFVHEGVVNRQVVAIKTFAIHLDTIQQASYDTPLSPEDLIKRICDETLMGKRGGHMASHVAATTGVSYAIIQHKLSLFLIVEKVDGSSLDAFIAYPRHWVQSNKNLSAARGACEKVHEVLRVSVVDENAPRGILCANSAHSRIASSQQASVLSSQQARDHC